MWVKLAKYVRLCLYAIVSVSLVQINLAQAQLLDLVGTGVGPIPDRGESGCGAQGPDLEISFDAPNTVGITDIQVDIDMTHTWVGDVSATLVAPNGDDHILFASTGSLSPTGCGHADDLAGLYTFSDILPTVGDWWTRANPYPVGVYRSTTPGDVGTGGGEEAVITDSFASTYGAGVWKLLVSDGGGGDTGSVSAANLKIATDSSTLTTTFEDNNGNSGSAFDITATGSDVKVNALDINLRDGDWEVSVYSKKGSYVNQLNNEPAWVRIANMVLSGKTGEPTFVNIADIDIPEGGTAGFIVFASGNGNIRYTNGNGTNEVTSNSDIRIFSDVGLKDETLFEWSSFNQPRVWNGTVYYQTGASSSCYVNVAENGNVLSFCL